MCDAEQRTVGPRRAGEHQHQADERRRDEHHRGGLLERTEPAEGARQTRHEQDRQDETEREVSRDVREVEGRRVLAQREVGAVETQRHRRGTAQALGLRPTPIRHTSSLESED